MSGKTSSNFPRPLTRTIDELALMNDVSLSDLSEICRSYIESGRSAGFSTKLWEEELCYILRECDIRETRATVHQQWMEELAETGNLEWTEPVNYDINLGE